MLRRLHQLFLRWNRDDAGLMSAAVAYYAVLSMFPLLLILTSGLGVFLRWTNAGQDAQHYILTAISEQLSPALADNVQVALEQVQQHASFSGPLGFITLLVAAMAMFAQFERAFDRIWNVSSSQQKTFLQTVLRVLTHRLRAFVMLVGVGVAILVVFFAGIALKAFHAFAHDSISGIVWLWWLIQTLLIISLNATVFGLLYKFLPKKSVRWIHAFRGGLFAALCWEFGQQILATFVIGQHYSNAYGLIGSLLAIMLWAYYSFGVIFLGAEYAQLLGEEFQRGKKAPRTTGDIPRSDEDNPPLSGEATVACVLLYVAVFLTMRHFGTHDVPAYRADARVVVFSRNPDGQQWCNTLFAPLIATFPGKFHYPNFTELDEVLNHIGD